MEKSGMTNIYPSMKFGLNRSLLRDIRFWIALFFVVRLVGIANAPLETGHNWRQSLTCMISRNFLEIDNNILYPRIDMAGEKTGIIGSEFPFFNYLIYLLAEAFGYEHWYGRLVNLLVSSLGIWYFYRIVLQFFNREIAFNAAVVLLASIWFAFSRKIMPDTFSVSLVIAGLFYGIEFLKCEKINAKYAILFTLLCTLGMLVKIPALSLFSGLAALPFIPNIEVKRKILLGGLSTFCLAIVFTWYFVWVPHLLETYRFQLYFPKSLSEGAAEIVPYMALLAEKFYFAALHSYLGFSFALFGLFWFSRKESKLYITLLCLIILVFGLFILKTGSVFPLHNYYVIPFVPLMALLAAYGLSKLKRNWQIAGLILICLEGTLNQQHDFFIRPEQVYKSHLESLTKQTIEPGEKVIINGGQSPQDIYFAHCRGWSIEPLQMQNPKYLDSLQQLGARFAIIDRKHDIALNDSLLYLDANYRIYQLHSAL